MAEPFQGKLALFILAGQSNMSGRGELPPTPLSHPQVFVFGNDYRWRMATEPVDNPTGQIDAVSHDYDAGYGPALAFATGLIERNPELAIGLIPCAKGNTAIEQWQRRLADTTLYGSCLKRSLAASTMGNIEGILFFQGETDALDPQQYPDRLLSAADYESKFVTFVHDMRRDLNQPNLPLVFAQIGSHAAPEAFVNWAVVQAQQAQVKLPCAAMITTDDLSLMDGVHYTTESYRIIGQRFAEAMADLRQNQSCQPQ
jgi:hypothetical protein